jgi:hypothetical protein
MTTPRGDGDEALVDAAIVGDAGTNGENAV